jgi:uncharacterized protein YbjT (DUF2867 family)
MGEVLDLAMAGSGYVPGDGTHKINPIHGKDLAEYIADLVEKRDILPTGAEYEVGGPETFTYRALMELAFKVARRHTISVTKVPSWILSAASTVSKPFNENASSLASLLSIHRK